jgi:hypothetical protein
MRWMAPAPGIEVPCKVVAVEEPPMRGAIRHAS